MNYCYNHVWKFQLIIFFISGGTFNFIFCSIVASDCIFKGVDSTLCTIFKVINEADDIQSVIRKLDFKE